MIRLRGVSGDQIFLNRPTKGFILFRDKGYHFHWKIERRAGRIRVAVAPPAKVVGTQSEDEPAAVSGFQWK